ncbi:MAG: S46 family peptidase [Thermoanaerobaculaceae bacterium]|nr:S46 family peptidase [Thermoanaerobaculaceae bacterium]MDI9621558.1 S46 family peptidase [Acidobacteriota bacterium]NLH11551.1 S46 family peptidase [Holophagae bacterium]HPW55186.1 S46 family peptidase [Thermoanaerobaculaceae bacterium]
MYVRTALATVSAVLAAVGVWASEGKWTPQQLSQLGVKWLREQGLQLEPSELWNPATSQGLLAAVADIGGCSSALVSPQGLLLTNHHCVWSVLQQHSRAGKNLIATGFLASTLEAELPAPSLSALFPTGFRDVTAELVGAAPAGADDLTRAHAVAQAEKALVAACEGQGDRRCKVAAFDDGLQYVLIESLEYRDVRLVYAPPRALGDFGGEVDNWMWPRHTGDFALLRLWGSRAGQPAAMSKDNVPLSTQHFLKLGFQGVTPGELVFTAGYPVRSFRSLTAPEMGERAGLYFPLRAELYSDWLTILQNAAAESEATRLALSDRMQNLANVAKNARGQVAGLRRGNLVEKKWALENLVLARAAARAEMREAVAARQMLASIVEQRRTVWRRDALLEAMQRGPLPLHFALTLVRWARERVKPDMERQPEYMERNRARLWEALLRAQEGFHLPTEKALMTDLFLRFAALPEECRSPTVDRFLGPARSREAIAGRVDHLLAPTRVLDWPSLKTMFDESFAALRLRRDPLLELAIALDDELRTAEKRREQSEGTISRLRPAWLAAVHELVGQPVSPDANQTLRVSFGHVKGYAPQDGLLMLPQTTLSGLLAKAGEEPPFTVSEAIWAASRRITESRWRDGTLGDIPVNFLADLDTSLGTSGSPILNARGELVGLNFDRVWEAVASDFGYDPELNRNISVDVRFLLWTLEEVEGRPAERLLRELGAKPF